MSRQNTLVTGFVFSQFVYTAVVQLHQFSFDSFLGRCFVDIRHNTSPPALCQGWECLHICIVNSGLLHAGEITSHNTYFFPGAFVRPRGAQLDAALLHHLVLLALQTRPSITHRVVVEF